MLITRILLILPCYKCGLVAACITKQAGQTSATLIFEQFLRYLRSSQRITSNHIEIDLHYAVAVFERQTKCEKTLKNLEKS